VVLPSLLIVKLPKPYNTNQQLICEAMRQGLVFFCHKDFKPISISEFGRMIQSFFILIGQKFHRKNPNIMRKNRASRQKR
jgi:hypothetical protein